MFVFVVPLNPAQNSNPTLVSVETTPRSQSGRNAADKRIAHSTYQPGFVVLRWFVCADSQHSPCSRRSTPTDLVYLHMDLNPAVGRHLVSTVWV